MMSISDVNTAARPVTPAEGVSGPSKVQRAEGKTQGSPIAPERDEYLPEEKREPYGRYWLGRDGEGQPKVYFDDPAPDKGADGPEKRASGDKAESCTGNTDKVDREIEKLKKKQAELERQLGSETDDTKIRELEGKLAQVESELRQKDNDTYRRQQSTFS